MKCYSFVLAITLLAMLSAAQAVTVDGFAYLTGQSNHAGTEVLFRAASPSAQTDSTYTDASGAFQADLHPGVYNVFYSHTGYATYPLPNQALLFATTLPPVTLMPPLSGSLSGTLGPGDFQVVDSIQVDSGQALTIVAGTKLWFEPRVWLLVRGELAAQGTEEDSIVFTKRLTHPDSAWGGIRIVVASAPATLTYCVIEHSRSWSQPQRWFTQSGGGMLIDSTTAEVAHCAIRENFGSDGGGVSVICGDSTLPVQISNSSFEHNIGGGASFTSYYGMGRATVSNSAFFENRAFSEGGAIRVQDVNISIMDSRIQQNHSVYGSGIYCQQANVLIRRCQIDSNVTATSEGYEGGGLELNCCQEVTLDHCVVSRNGTWLGGGIYMTGSNANLLNCSFVRNHALQGSAVYLYGSSYARIENCVIAMCDTAARQPVYRTYAGAIYYYDDSEITDISYCDFFHNILGNFAFEQDTVSPTAIGIVALTNANGDSCDTYYNIYQDPMFVDTASGDYHLRAESPCIDAGDPALPYDPDNTIADIGAFYYPHPAATDRGFIPHPSSLILSCYPNPFNSTTRIAFNLPHEADVKLAVFDVTGRLAATLVSGKMNAGRHEVRFDGTNLASGVYFARIQASELLRTQKLVLLK